MLKNETKKTEKVSTPDTEMLNVLGNYVSEDYSKRSEGFDWVLLRLLKVKSNQLNISVRSRADKKEPLAHLMQLPKNPRGRPKLTKLKPLMENPFFLIY